jgi:GDP/UDP-N,N'-diacetylbacillosamine 2-epimerase (hydrolysing)
VKKKILFVTSSRADYSPSKSFIKLLKKRLKKDFYLLVTGTHLSKKDGYTIQEIKDDRIKIDFKINILSHKNKYFNKTTQIAVITFKKFIEFFSKFKPNLLIILGDRFEILPIAYAAYLNNICIAHINGGEITEGSIDDSIRHSITKLSYLHFCSTEINKKRIINFGENPKRVKNFGYIGIDTLRNSKLLDKKTLTNNLNIKFNKKNLILTFHPETFETKNHNKKKALLIINTLIKHKDINFFITASNIDKGGEEINKIFKKASKKNKNFRYFKSLGEKYYFSLLQFCDGIIGNSSSGIIECPSFKKGTINLGNRQQGRTISKLIIQSNINKKSIDFAIKKLYSKNFKKKLRFINNLYEKKNTAKNMFNFIKKTEIPKNNLKKFFTTKN